MYAYAGGFYYEGSHGITTLSFNEKTGEMQVMGHTADDLNAGCVVVRNGMLYATDEVDTVDGKAGGRVVSFRIHPETGELTREKEVSTLGAKPAGIVFDEKSGYMLVAHFSIEFHPCVKVRKDKEGNWISEKIFPECLIDLFSIHEDGSIGELLDVMVIPQASPDFASCVHKVFYNQRDDIYCYGNLTGGYIGFFKLDRKNGRFIPVDERLLCEAGAGPRHEVFSKKLPYLYCNYESKPVVSQFLVSDEKKEHIADYLFWDECYQMDPRKDNQSEILLNRDEMRLYNVIRGIGMVYVFDINQENGALSLLQAAPLNTKVPRGASFTPDENYLCFAGNDNDTVEIWKVHEDGTIHFLSRCDGVKRCACITFVD